MGLRNIEIRNSPSDLVQFFLCLHILVRPGLYFDAINLKFLQKLDLIEGYNLLKLLINSLQIKVRTSYLFGKNSKICNRLL